MSNDKYRRILSAFYGECWAILPEKLAAIAEFLELKASGAVLSDEEIEARVGRPRKATRRVAGNVAVLPLLGVMGQRMNMMLDMSGGTSTDIFGQWFDSAMADKSVGAVVLDIDSPGGSVFGLEALSKKIFEARGKKPIIAVANSLAASAAYYVGTAADELVMSPGALVGSVGTVAMHTDISARDEKEGFKTTLISAGEHKTEGNPFEPLTTDARGDFQAKVDMYYEQFTSDVARNRGTTKAMVKRHFGGGRVYGTTEARNRNMADREATLEQVLSELGVKSPSAALSAMALSVTVDDPEKPESGASDETVTIEVDPDAIEDDDSSDDAPDVARRERELVLLKMEDGA